MYKILKKSFDTEKEYLDFIVENENLIIDTKKSAIKHSDGLLSPCVAVNKTLDNVSKEEGDNAERSIRAKIVINSTNVIDSHLDVHVKGLWKKSLDERGKNILHLQEHKRTFDAVISRGENLKAYTEEKNWSDIGFDMEGKTELLVFDSVIKEDVNPFMYKQYEMGNVNEHSVGMQYVKMATCINDEDYPVQKENWDKYAPLVANKNTLKETKVFWAVTEAKVIEGSAVLMGSNSFTPTLNTSQKTKPELTEKDIQANVILKWLGVEPSESL